MDAYGPSQYLKPVSDIPYGDRDGRQKERRDLLPLWTLANTLQMDSSAYTYVGLVNQNLVLLFSYYLVPRTKKLFLDLLYL
jgi:hypothetical protein